MAAAGALGAVAYATVVRPWYLTWGTAAGERDRALPGDDLVPGARLQSTRAVTVAAPASAVWPWLVQMGQGRGGLYSYDWLENLFGCDLHSADRVVAEWQHVSPGDRVRLVKPPEGDEWALEVAIVDPPTAFVLRTPGPAHGAAPQASWAFVVLPTGRDECRLFARWRATWEPGLAGWLSNAALVPPVHFVMERKMLLGIKARAERGLVQGQERPSHAA